ncbi:hypothetical protein [Bradyrhizobium sp. STM 3557]|uniref:hypothetical protein n=1 Tax=Bradyrhizobium sp. STM 3557 TaxID=578920 RepID=UPI00388F51CD
MSDRVTHRAASSAFPAFVDFCVRLLRFIPDAPQPLRSMIMIHDHHDAAPDESARTASSGVGHRSA